MSKEKLDLIFAQCIGNYAKKHPEEFYAMVPDSEEFNAFYEYTSYVDHIYDRCKNSIGLNDEKILTEICALTVQEIFSGNRDCISDYIDELLETLLNVKKPEKK